MTADEKLQAARNNIWTVRTVMTTATTATRPRGDLFRGGDGNGWRVSRRRRSNRDNEAGWPQFSALVWPATAVDDESGMAAFVSVDGSSSA